MISRSFLTSFSLLLLVGAPAWAQVKVPAPAVAPVGAREPVLRLEAGGPTAHVTALAFSPDGKTLYAAGFDKVVQVWNFDAPTGQFVLDPFAYRVPIGPGTDGVINALAVSPDGDWLAASGLGVFRGAADFRQAGYVLPTLSLMTGEMLQDRGMIYLFHTRTRTVRVLRGHEGLVLALAFAPAHPDKPPLLISAAQERTGPAKPSVGQIRLWDVSKAAPADAADQGAALETVTMPTEPRSPPGLAIRHTGRGLKQLRVALAGNDGKLRVWELGQQGPARVHEVVDGLAGWDNTAVYLPTQPTLLAGSSGKNGGQLRGWQDQPGRPPEPAFEAPLVPPASAPFVLPCGLGLVAAQGNGRIDHAAVVVRSGGDPKKGAEFWLRLVDLAGYRVVATAPLWSGQPIIPPALATSANASHVAVTDNQDGSILVFRIADLLRNQALPQRLHSVGAAVRSVSFVRQARTGELGLFLSERPKAAPGSPARLTPDGLVFDFAQRSLAADPGKQGWDLSGPRLDNWEVSASGPVAVEKKNRWVFAWKGPAARGQVVLELKTTQEVRDHALLPPLKGGSPVPILAVAWWDYAVAEPTLALYNAQTSEQVRLLKGHTRSIHALAASRDGRLLASAADDQTVCLWSLADLNTLGQRGTLSGLFPQRQGEHLIVAAVDSSSPAYGKLQVGDRIEGVVAKDGAQPRMVTSASDFFAVLSRLKPQEKIAVQIERQGMKRTVELTLVQFVEDRKPLLSLFLTKATPREWIAWTPLGPYDRSSQDIERYLGWHFNPGKPGEASTFARAEAYRDKFYKPALLKPLLAHGDLTKALEEIDKPAALPKPGIDSVVESAGETGREDAQGQILVRRPDVTLQLTIAGPSLDKDQVEAITWRLENSTPQALDLKKATGQRLTETLRLPDRRGIYTLAIQVRTREANPQQVTRTLTLRYQPPPPAIQFDAAWLKQHFGAGSSLRAEVRQAQFPLEAQVRPGSPDQEVQVAVRLNGQDLTLPPGLTIRQALPLQPEENVVELQAQNRGALPGYEAFESDQQALVLLRQAEAAPQLLLKEIELVAPQATRLPITPGKPVVVSTRRVHVRGTVTAAENLESVEIQNAKGDVTVKTAPGKPTFALDQQLTLEPGQQTFRLLARTAGGKAAEARLSLEYQPPLPQLHLIAPQPDLVLQEGKDAPEVEVKGELSSADDDFQPFRIVVQVYSQGQLVPQANGQNQLVISFKDKQQLAAQEGQLQTLAKVRLRPGDNRVRVQVSNDWQGSAVTERAVSYRRPPRIVRFQASPPGEKPFANLEAEVTSPPDLPLTAIEINGEKHSPAAVAQAGPRGPETTTWTLRVPEIPLEKGRNTIRLVVANDQGPCLQEGTVNVNFQPDPPDPPQIGLLQPREEGATARDRTYTVQFSVRSTSRLKSVKLLRGSQEIGNVDVSKQVQNVAQGYFEVEKAQLEVSLEPNRANLFRLVAVNEEIGKAERPVTITHVRTPARLVVEKPPAEVQDAKLRLTGHIAFQEDGEELLTDQRIHRVRVYVNGFQQRPAVLQPRSGTSRQRRFTTEIVLNRQASNLIEVECPELPLEAERKQEFAVQCLHPEQPRTLHVLVVGVDVGLGVPKKERDGLRDKLVQQVFTALQTKADSQGLRSAVFDRVLMHPYSADFPDQKVQLLTGHVHTGQVRNGLNSIRKFIDEKGSPSDVVLIYWLGKDAVYEGGEWYLPTSESRFSSKLSETAIPLQDLVGAQNDLLGARVVLLDVASAAAPLGTLTFDWTTTRSAVLRYAWSKQEIPVPGLLQALEQAALASRKPSLQDVARTADRVRTKYADRVVLTHNLQLLSPLASLVVSQKP